MEKNYGDMYAYILESKKVTNDIVMNQDSIFEKAEQYILQHEIEQIYIIGSGTSYHAALAAKPLLEKVLSMKVFVSYPIIFKEEQIFNPKTLVIGISHAGKSSSTILGLGKAKSMGLATIAMSAEDNTPIFEHADEKQMIEIGEELAGPKTKGYIGAIVTLMVFGLRVALKTKKISKSTFDDYLIRMVENTNAIPEIAETTSQWYEQNKEELIKCRRLYIIGYDQCLSAMMEGTLKILEAVRYSVQGYEMEEFMHGIYHAINEDVYMLYIGCDGQYYDRMLRLRGYFDRERTKHNFVITSKEDGNSKNIVFPFTNDADFAVLQFIIPMQVIARKLSLDLGIDCNIPSDPDFHRKMASYIYK